MGLTQYGFIFNYLQSAESGAEQNAVVANFLHPIPTIHAHKLVFGMISSNSADRFYNPRWCKTACLETTVSIICIA